MKKAIFWLFILVLLYFLFLKLRQRLQPEVETQPFFSDGRAAAFIKETQRLYNERLSALQIRTSEQNASNAAIISEAQTRNEAAVEEREDDPVMQAMEYIPSVGDSIRIDIL